MWVSQLVCQGVWQSGKRSLQLPFRNPEPQTLLLVAFAGPCIDPHSFFLWWAEFKVDLGVSP